MRILMWEVRATPGRLDDLVAAVSAAADPSRSRSIGALTPMNAWS